MIEVLSSAPFNSIQDDGRRNMRDYGIARGGVMDTLALRLGNMMLGNPDNAAAIEVQMAPLALHFHAAATVAITGADFGARIDGIPLPAWWSMQVAAGQVLRLTRPQVGARAYVCVSGGIDVPEVLGSRGTMFVEKIGGYQGREIAAGDRLPVSADAAPHGAFGIVPPSVALDDGGAPGEVVLRYIRSDERGMFDAPSLERFENDGWIVSRLGNRQGFRLEGEALVRLETVEMRSHGIMEGVIQVPPSGLPLIQLADGNSAGGYPKLGVVCSADLWRLVQASPGAVVRFRPVTIQEAATARAELESYIADVRRHLSFAPLRPVEA